MKPLKYIHDQGRQGDLYFTRVSRINDLYNVIKHDGIIAFGEITGHKHKLKSGKLFIIPPTTESRGNIIAYVSTPEKSRSIVDHDEHGKVILDKNSIYEVKQQRELTQSTVLNRYTTPKAPVIKIHRVRD